MYCAFLKEIHLKCEISTYCQVFRHETPVSRWKDDIIKKHMLHNMYKVFLYAMVRLIADAFSLRCSHHNIKMPFNYNGGCQRKSTTVQACETSILPNMLFSFKLKVCMDSST